MTKADLIEMLAEKANITRVKAEKVVETVFDSIKEALKNGDRVEVRGFGCFEVRHYGGYQGRNPKTGEVIEIAKKQLPHFKVGKELKMNLRKV